MVDSGLADRQAARTVREYWVQAKWNIFKQSLFWSFDMKLGFRRIKTDNFIEGIRLVEVEKTEQLSLKIPKKTLIFMKPFVFEFSITLLKIPHFSVECFFTIWIQLVRNFVGWNQDTSFGVCRNFGLKLDKSLCRWQLLAFLDYQDSIGVDKILIDFNTINTFYRF